MSRSRRARRFAAPIVITVVSAGCAPAEPPHVNPPAPNPPAVTATATTGTPADAPGTVAPTPPPRDLGRGNPPPPELPLPSGKGHVEKQPDGTCIEYASMPACPAGMACNPPPPHPVRCP